MTVFVHDQKEYHKKKDYIELFAGRIPIVTFLINEGKNSNYFIKAAVLLMV